MPKNSMIDHDTATQVVDFFAARTKKLERKVTARLGYLSRDSQRRIVQGVDREVEAEFGFPMRKLYEL